MPPKKPSQLHKIPKGKPSGIAKPTLSPDIDGEELNHEESLKQYQTELLWCIQQLEKSLAQNKETEKNGQEAWKALQILKNNNQPIIRKRQLMRQHFGDYRSKMRAEEKKLIKMAAKMKIQSNTAPPKATFLRKSAFLTSGNENFKFNFEIPPENIDTGIEETNLLSGNTQICSSNGNTKSNILAGNTQECSNSEKKSSTNNFKLNFSNTEFKFNFSQDNAL